MNEKLKKDIRGLLALLRQVYENGAMPSTIDDRNTDDAIGNIEVVLNEINNA